MAIAVDLDKPVKLGKLSKEAAKVIFSGFCLAWHAGLQVSWVHAPLYNYY